MLGRQNQQISVRPKGFIHGENAGKSFPSKGTVLYNELSLCTGSIGATFH